MPGNSAVFGCVLLPLMRYWLALCLLHVFSFRLQTCEAAFATKDRLRAHMVRHEEKVPCHVCGKLLSAAYITDHMKVHNQGPNHVCELCNKGKSSVMCVLCYTCISRLIRHHTTTHLKPLIWHIPISSDALHGRV